MAFIRLSKAFIQHAKNSKTSTPTDINETMILLVDNISSITENERHGEHNNTANGWTYWNVNTVTMKNGDQHYTMDSIDQIEQKLLEAENRQRFYRTPRSIERKGQTANS